MFFLRYITRYLYKGIWTSTIVTGLVFGYAYFKRIPITWFMVQQTNIWLFVVMAGFGLPMSFADSGADMRSTVRGKFFLRRSYWENNPKAEITDHFLPLGGRIVVMSLIPFAVYFITMIWV